MTGDSILLGSWHEVCLYNVGLWLQLGRKDFETLGGEDSETPAELHFFRRELRIFAAILILLIPREPLILSQSKTVAVRNLKQEVEL